MPSYWPLFELEIVTPRLVLRTPTDGDFPGLIAAVDAGIHDPDVMPFTFPWTDDPPEERRLRSVQHWWRARASWNARDWHLTLAVFLDGEPVGCQDMFAKDFAVLREFSTGSWLTLGAQGRGIGKEMRAGVLQLAFEGLGAEVARSGAFLDNASSLAVSRALGYRDNGYSREAPRGRARPQVHFEMTREEWLARRDQLPRAEIRGLRECLAMFGV
jgi:RimJ/RimL family protein N-acetyltransferase